MHKRRQDKNRRKQIGFYYYALGVVVDLLRGILGVYSDFNLVVGEVIVSKLRRQT